MKSSIQSWAWALAAATLTSAAPATTLNERASISTSDLSNMKFYAEYAATAYCNSQNSVGQAITCSSNACPTVTSDKATTYKTFNGVVTDIQGLIAIDPAKSLIVLSIRGSSSLRNWITDIVFAKSDCDIVSGCQVHTGFAAAWAEIGSSVLAGVKAARAAHPTFKIIATGHSLGGAVATMAAAYLRSAGNAVDLYTYGSPRVGNDAFANFVSAQSGLEIRVTHLDDPVPRLPPLLFNYRHTSPEYWLSDGTATTTNYGVSDVVVCTGSANTDCNASTGGLDVEAHLHYLIGISDCSSGFSFKKRDVMGMSMKRDITDAQLEERLNMFTALDIQYAAQLASGQ